MRRIAHANRIRCCNIEFRGLSLALSSSKPLQCYAWAWDMDSIHRMHAYFTLVLDENGEESPEIRHNMQYAI